VNPQNATPTSDIPRTGGYGFRLVLPLAGRVSRPKGRKRREPLGL